MNALRLRWLLVVALFAVCCNIGLAAAPPDWPGAPAALPSAAAKAGHAKSVLNAEALTGLWYAPSQNGHGFALTFDAAGHVAATWYVYQGTRQVWLIGSGSLDGNVALLPTVITAGGNFPPNFTPGSVTLTDWGTLTLTVQACDRITVSWTSGLSGFGSGSVDVQPLIVAGAQPCAVTSTDDRPDRCVDATAVPFNGEYAARIDPEGDQDFYRIDLSQRGIVLARSRSSLDLVGAIYDANCNPIAQNDDADGGIPGDANQYDFSTRAVLAPGTYYVSAAGYSSETTGDYTLQLSFDANVPADDFGDSCIGAPALALGASVNGRIDPALDIDYFRVDLTGQTALLARIPDVNGGLDTVVAIRDANCQILAQNDDFDSQASQVSAVLGAGTYYVSVRAYNASTSGDYTLALSRAADNDDHGDFCTVATPTTPGATATGQIGTANDWDFFAVDLPAPGTLSILTSDTSTLDPQVTLYESSCSPLAADDDGGPGRDVYLTYSPAPGRYYFRVRASDGVGTGAYTVSTRFVASTPEQDEHGDDCAHATPIAQSGNAAGIINTANDRDFFRVDTDVGAFFSARTYAEPHVAIAILDSACQVRAENPGPDDGSGNGLRVTAPATPGTYYIRLRSTDGSTGLYSFDYSPRDTATGSGAGKRASAKRAEHGKLRAPQSSVEFRSAQATPVLAHAFAPAAHGKSIANPSALSGLWYDPAQNGQGVQITFDANGTVALTWYVYQGTQQVWLIGSGTLAGNRVTLPMVISSGADFLPAFDPNAVTLTPWGNVTLEVRGCDSIAMSWAPTLAGYGAGSMNLSSLIVSGGLTCAVSSEADDHGNDCAHADAAALDGTTAGRIDPPSDQDFFRISVGSAGTLTVQSSGSSTLNPSGTLLDANCVAIAASDDVAGREFSIVRTVSAGTYYVGVAASGATTLGDYTLGTAFTPATGGTSSAANVTLRNDLIYDVDYRINGGASVRVGAGASFTQSLTLSGALSVSFQLDDAVNAIGQPVGDLLGGTFDPVANPSGNLSFVVDNEVGAQRYFAPVISNKTNASFLVGTNMGTSAENRCNCTVGPSAQNIRIGYYLLLPKSNVRAYAVGSNYGGPYAYWGDDTGGGRPLFGIPLVNLLESPSGRIQLKYIP